MSKFHIEKEQDIISMYQNNVDTVKIAKKYNTYNTSIRRVLLRNNIKIRSNAEVQNTIDNNVFDLNSLTREDYYFLGFLITDGSITDNRITLGLKEEDIYMLERFAKFLGPRIKVHKYFHKAHAKYQYEVKVGNKKLAYDLKKLAVFDNKTYDLKLHIPLNFDILRGIIDGDGSISETSRSSHIHIFGVSLIFLKQIEDFLKIYNIKCSILNQKTCYKLSVYKNADVFFLYKKMYYSTDLFLKRKKNKFGPVVKKFTT